MADYTLRYEVGNIFAGETDQLWLPGSSRDKYGVVLFHGAGATSANQFAEITRWASAQVPAFFASRGIPCVAGVMGGDTFGNATGVSRVAPAISYLETTGGASTEKAHLVGFSMGFSNMINYAKDNLESVASLVGVMPLCDIDSVYQGDLGGLRSEIEAAWGVVHPAALPAGADLSVGAAAIAAAGIPVKIYYSAADTLVLPETVETLGAILNAELVEFQGLAHTEAGFNSIGEFLDGSWSDVINFLKEHGA